MTDLNIPIPNLSLFSPNKFRVVIQRFPGVNFFAQKLTLPTVTLGQTKISTNEYVDFYTPGDKVQYEDLTIEFVLDEDLVSYIQLKEWMVDAARKELYKKNEKNDFRFSDMQIIALTNNSNKNKAIQFYNTFPYSITPIPIDTRLSEEAITVSVVFKYSEFNILTE